MRIYDIDGKDILNESKSLSFERNYSFLNGLLTCEQKTIDTTTGALSDSAIRCVIHLPKHGCIEVKQARFNGKFKLLKVSNGTVTYLTPGTDWWYYTIHYVGDDVSNYYALVANSDNDTTNITPTSALSYIHVYSFSDAGDKTDIVTSLSGKHIAFFGDSITQGRFQKYTSSGLDFTAAKPFGVLVGETVGDMNFGNFGIGNATVGSNDWKSLVTNKDKITGYDIVFICAGTNDYGFNTTSTAFTNAYSSIVETLKSNNTEVVCCSPVYRTSKTGKNSAGLDLWDYCNLIKNVAQTKGCKYIDMYTPTNDGKFITYCPDGLHPNEMGHKIMADIILEEYEKLSV